MAAEHDTAVALSRNGHKEHGPQGVNQKALRRLKNIEGQVRGIQKMVEEQKYCVDILTQISAVRAGLDCAERECHGYPGAYHGFGYPG